MVLHVQSRPLSPRLFAGQKSLVETHEWVAQVQHRTLAEVFLPYVGPALSARAAAPGEGGALGVDFAAALLHGEAGSNEAEATDEAGLISQVPYMRATLLKICIALMHVYLRLCLHACGLLVMAMHVSEPCMCRNAYKTKSKEGTLALQVCTRATKQHCPHQMQDV